MTNAIRPGISASQLSNGEAQAEPLPVLGKTSDLRERSEAQQAEG